MNIRVRVKNSLQYYFTPVFFIDLVHLRRWKLIVCFYVFTGIFGEKKSVFNKFGYFLPNHKWVQCK